MGFGHQAVTKAVILCGCRQGVTLFAVEYCAEELEFGCSQQQKREDPMDITAATRAPIKGIKSATEDLMEQASELSERMGKTANDALKQSKRALGRLQDSTEDVIQDTRQN